MFHFYSFFSILSWVWDNVCSLIWGNAESLNLSLIPVRQEEPIGLRPLCDRLAVGMSQWSSSDIYSGAHMSSNALSLDLWAESQSGLEEMAVSKKFAADHSLRSTFRCFKALLQFNLLTLSHVMQHLSTAWPSCLDIHCVFRSEQCWMWLQITQGNVKSP